MTVSRFKLRRSKLAETHDPRLTCLGAWLAELRRSAEEGGTSIVRGTGVSSIDHGRLKRSMALWFLGQGEHGEGESDVFPFGIDPRH